MVPNLTMLKYSSGILARICCLSMQYCSYELVTLFCATEHQGININDRKAQIIFTLMSVLVSIWQTKSTFHVFRFLSRTDKSSHGHSVCHGDKKNAA